MVDVCAGRNSERADYPLAIPKKPDENANYENLAAPGLTVSPEILDRARKPEAMTPVQCQALRDLLG